MSAKKYTFPYYKIKKGETLKSICQKFNIDSVELLVMNNMSPIQIKEGVCIKIR